MIKIEKKKGKKWLVKMNGKGRERSESSTWGGGVG